MTPEQREAQARTRYFVISLLRLAGALMAFFGLVITGGRFESIPPLAGYVLVAIGVVEMAVVPRMLARRWRTPAP